MVIWDRPTYQINADQFIGHFTLNDAGRIHQDIDRAQRLADVPLQQLLQRRTIRDVADFAEYQRIATAFFQTRQIGIGQLHHINDAQFL